MTLDGILDPDCVICDVTARSKKHALDILSELLAGGEQPLPKLAVFDSLVSRERLGSTAIGCAVAIPHARLDNLKKIRAAFVRLTDTVDFDAADGKPVRFLFGLLVPSEEEQNHLNLLSTIASMLASESFRESLNLAPDADALYDILTDFPAPASDDAINSR